ncbi:hypothetical protein [Embleya sp. NPDC005575]|uniref:hypothetical protein n=1 Tax=Embleya sp. NPDC005575 TaxID=3156892 RepID=UPI0033B03FC3
MGNSRRSVRCAARCLLVAACVGLPAVAGCADAFADERVTVTVQTGSGPTPPVGPRTEVDVGRVHVVYQPGVLTFVRLGDDVAVIVRPGCGCPTWSPPPTATRPPSPPRPRPPAPAPAVTKATERAPVAPPPTRPPPAVPARPYLPVVLDSLPKPPSVPPSEIERPPAPRPLRIVAAPPDDDDPSSPGFADGIGPALIVSILPAALAALLPHPGRRGVRS